MIYTQSQMLDEWKMRLCLEPLRTDAVTQRQDAFDIDAYLIRMIDAWYLDILDNGDPRLLDTVDISSRLTFRSFINGVATYGLPPHCRRVTSVFSSFWNRPALIIPPHDKRARFQDCEFARGHLQEPVAIIFDSSIRIYSFPSGVTTTDKLLSSVQAAMVTEGQYSLDPTALSTIPSSL